MSNFTEKYKNYVWIITFVILTLCHPVLSYDNFCKQFDPGSGLTKIRTRFKSKLFDTLMVFLKDFFLKIKMKRNQQMTRKNNKKNYNMILSCYNYGRVTIIYDAIVNY